MKQDTISIVEIDYAELTLFLSLNVNMLTFCFWGWWGLLLCNCNNKGGKGITKLDCSYVPRVERPTWPAETCGICSVCVQLVSCTLLSTFVTVNCTVYIRVHQNSKKFSKSHGLLIYFVPTCI